MKTFLSLLFLLIISSCSSINEPKSLAVTIYNDNFAMVKDVREIQFQKGDSFLYFTDVSANIQTETVSFKPLQTNATIRIYEQNFERNLINKYSLLKKFIQKDIKLTVRLGEMPKIVSGTLLGYDDGYIVKTNSGIDVYNNIESIEFPELPEGFFTKPTLNWKVFSDSQTKTDCEVAYRTTGFGWKADYSITLDENEKIADIGGWVTIDNNSGKKYVNAKLKLIAGDVKTVTPALPSNTMYKYPTAYAKPAAAPSFTQKSFADYHMYTLSQQVTLNESSQKQVEFIPKVYNVTVRKYYQISLTAGGSEIKNLKPLNKVQFLNSKEIGLGIPLPKGTIRAFKRDTIDDSLQFIGQDQIAHTPKDQNITITTGTAFDIVANIHIESRQTFSSNGYRAKMSITIANHKQTPVQIELLINNYYGDNLSISWDGEDSQLLRSSANVYKSNIKSILPGEIFTAKWEQNYSP